MHREIMNPSKSFLVDHKNHNRLDNRKKNLRVCTFAENAKNARWRSDSWLKGVTWHKATQKWAAQIQVNGKRIHLGLFTSKVSARRKYIATARVVHGEYANP